MLRDSQMLLTFKKYKPKFCVQWNHTHDWRLPPVHHNSNPNLNEAVSFSWFLLLFEQLILFSWAKYSSHGHMGKLQCLMMSSKTCCWPPTTLITPIATITALKTYLLLSIQRQLQHTISNNITNIATATQLLCKRTLRHPRKKFNPICILKFDIFIYAKKFYFILRISKRLIVLAGPGFILLIFLFCRILYFRLKKLLLFLCSKKFKSDLY